MLTTNLHGFAESERISWRGNGVEGGAGSVHNAPSTVTSDRRGGTIQADNDKTSLIFDRKTLQGQSRPALRVRQGRLGESRRHDDGDDCKFLHECSSLLLGLALPASPLRLCKQGTANRRSAKILPQRRARGLNCHEAALTQRRTVVGLVGSDKVPSTVLPCDGRFLA